MDNAMHTGIYIALGANQAYRGASPLQTLNSAIRALHTAGVETLAASRPWRTPAWPDPSDPPFVNACIKVRTALQPPDLMAALHTIETAHGRQRGARNAPRTLDLDLIDYDRLHQVLPGGLVLPHPRAAQRAFVLLPLREIAPHWRDPASGARIDALIGALPLAERQACRRAGGVLCTAA
ncbi:2-amino-4-hydroxy-6-hydroxymethyldihydropteridine diphosphokinase [Alkalicaulis satelles]|uniref:2-amino-4-hydroxy-6-hydroxymethyldihydropteridine pyrophosphokinase n=2 Tax=Alkalicaulis satelles TaxID=2609175 RepID=A0A5M6ZQG7_9PROT|nr:2-amino-4-hydroxy-6-hydroxymethyldihydropteridine diphosphokinase [Alkalicaulis satelles]